METKRIDKLKLVLWGGTKEHQDKLCEEMSKAKIVCQKASSSDDWLQTIQRGSYHAGAIILTAENFTTVMEISKRTRSQNKDIPLFLFAASKEDGHLLTEAEENGFNDHFYLPVDIDLIATKFGRYFFQEDLQKIQLGQTIVPKAKASARLHLKCQVVSVDENGMNLRSNHLIAKGTEIKMQNSDVLFFLGYGEITMVVEKSAAEDDNTFSVYAEWKNNPEEMANAVRKWSMEMKR